MTSAQRPSYSRSQISSKNHWILEEISDFNVDAMDAVCWSCEATMSWGQWLNSFDYSTKVKCHSCEKLVLCESSVQALPQRVAEEVQDSGYFDRTWYHASTRKNWAQSARRALQGQLIVHAGSRIAALSRADTLIEENGIGTAIYLHSFRLRSSSAIARTVLDDACDSWQDELIDPRFMEVCPIQGEDAKDTRLSLSTEGYRGAPYYNRYEVPGDISLLIHAKLIQLNTVETVKLQRS